MASSAVGKKDSRFTPVPANQQPPGNHFQQRERSFIRDGNRSGGPSGAFQNTGTSGGKARGGSHPGGNGATPSSAPVGRGKPNMEIYRPPSMRSETAHVGSGRLPQFTDHQPPRLTKSRTSLELNNNSTKMANKGIQQNNGMAAVTTIPIQQQSAKESNASQTNQFVLQRSKSGGSSLSLQQQKVPVPTPTSQSPVATSKTVSSSELPDVSLFPEASQILLRKIAVDPDGANSRSIIDAVKTLFSRVIESSRYASPVARYCSYVIEKETKETFRESLLNTCQESFQERDKLLRSGGSSQRWVAFINFLNEMYLQLKRRNLSMKTKSGSKRPSPDLILLSLLAESCCATLKKPSTDCLQELECLFFVLTGIGRDIETELAGKMSAIWNAIRDAFLEMNALPGAAQRTLLQLVELRAAKWQLPATAVTYYYPSASGSAF